MSTTDPAPRPGANRTPLYEPGRRLSPRPEDDRPWRTVLILIAAVVLALTLLALTVATTTSWRDGRRYSEVPATTELGAPVSLTLATDVADVRVLASSDVDQVTMALVDEGGTALPVPGTEVRAHISQQGEAANPVLDVRQPDRFTSLPWNPGRLEVLVLVPVGHSLALDLTTEVGDIRADGDFSAVSVRTEVGDIGLAPVSAPDGLTVQSDVGDVEVELEGPAPAAVDITTGVGEVDLLLPTDAGGDVTVTSDVGGVGITAPGSGTWRLDAGSELGTVTVAPGLTGSGSEIGTITATSEVGDVSITR